MKLLKKLEDIESVSDHYSQTYAGQRKAGGCSKGAQQYKRIQDSTLHSIVLPSRSSPLRSPAHAEVRRTTIRSQAAHASRSRSTAAKLSTLTEVTYPRCAHCQSAHQPANCRLRPQPGSVTVSHCRLPPRLRSVAGSGSLSLKMPDRAECCNGEEGGCSVVAWAFGASCPTKQLPAEPFPLLFNPHRCASPDAPWPAASSRRSAASAEALRHPAGPRQPQHPTDTPGWGQAELRIVLAQQLPQAPPVVPADG